MNSTEQVRAFHVEWHFPGSVHNWNSTTLGADQRSALDGFYERITASYDVTPVVTRIQEIEVHVLDRVRDPHLGWMS